MRKELVIIPLIAIVFILSGCLKNPEEIAKTNQMVNDFLEKYPDAEIQITHFSIEQSSKMIDQIREVCSNPYLESKELYRVTVEDQKSGLSAIAYINSNDGVVECAVKKVSLGIPLEKEEVEIEKSVKPEVVISDIDKINPTSKPVTSLYIFSSINNPGFEGEGFFLDLSDGNELFIYSNFDDYPHDIANTARKLLAIARDVGSFTYSKERVEEVYKIIKR